MRWLSVAIALAATACLSAPSLAVAVQEVRGQVLLNTGTGYRPVQSGMTANPGAIVVARPGGSARVVYPDGCVVPVSASTPPINPIHRVLEESPCQRRDVGYTYYLVPALAIAGGTTAIILLTQNNDDKPASP